MKHAAQHSCCAWLRFCMYENLALENNTLMIKNLMLNKTKITIMKKSVLKLLACVVALWICSTQNLSAQMVAVRTDALKDLLMTPNVGVDLVVGEKFTLGAEVAFARDPWLITKDLRDKNDLRLTSVTPEFRYWFNGRPLTRQYVGLVANMTAYEFKFGESMHQGDAYGVGLSFGHVWTLTQRWNIDLSGSCGLVGYRERYTNTKNGAVPTGDANAWGYTLFPIKLGVSVVYVIR